MIIIYYRHKETGKILHVHAAHAGQTMADISPLAEEYNAQGRDVAAAVEVADDSLEAHLFNTRNKRFNADKEAIRDAIDALQQALDAVRDLEG